jgi:hypothetical protein
MFPQKAFKWKENSSFSHCADPSQQVYYCMSPPKIPLAADAAKKYFE